MATGDVRQRHGARRASRMRRSIVADQHRCYLQAARRCRPPLALAVSTRGRSKRTPCRGRRAAAIINTAVQAPTRKARPITRANAVAESMWFGRTGTSTLLTRLSSLSLSVLTASTDHPPNTAQRPEPSGVRPRYIPQHGPSRGLPLPFSAGTPLGAIGQGPYRHPRQIGGRVIARTSRGLALGLASRAVGLLLVPRGRRRSKPGYRVNAGSELTHFRQL